MQLLRTQLGATETLKLRGRFDWHTINNFNAEVGTNLGNPAVQAISIDLGDVDYIDSAAIGALLVLRDKMRIAGKALSLSGARGPALQTLKDMSIDQLIAMK